MHTNIFRALVAAAALAALPAGAAHASSLVYAKDDAVWVAGPDGSHATKLTSGSAYASPSQADDGTIVAMLADGSFVRLDRRGQRIGAPVANWVSGKGYGFSGPYDPRVSPDGTKVAYTYYYDHVEYDYSCACTHETVSRNTGYSWSDRYTDPSVFGLLHEWAAPSWHGNSTTIVWSPGVSELFPGYTDAVYHKVGMHDAQNPADPNDPNDDSANAFLWFDDSAHLYLQKGELSRDGTKLAAAEGAGADLTAIRLYTVPIAPPADAASDQPPVYRCSLDNPPGGSFSAPTWAPDGSALAYSAGGDLYVVQIGDLASGCAAVGAPVKVVPGATSPSWGPADVPPATTTPSPSPAASSATAPSTAPSQAKPLTVTATVAGKELAKALAHGLRVRLTLSAAAKVTITGRRGATPVANGSARATRAGATSVLVTFTRSARRTLRRARTLRLKLAVLAGDATGRTARGTQTVVLTRKGSR